MRHTNIGSQFEILTYLLIEIYTTAETIKLVYINTTLVLCIGERCIICAVFGTTAHTHIVSLIYRRTEICIIPVKIDEVALIVNTLKLSVQERLNLNITVTLGIRFAKCITEPIPSAI